MKWLVSCYRHPPFKGRTGQQGDEAFRRNTIVSRGLFVFLLSLSSTKSSFTLSVCGFCRLIWGFMKCKAFCHPTCSGLFPFLCFSLFLRKEKKKRLLLVSCIAIEPFNFYLLLPEQALDVSPFSPSSLSTYFFQIYSGLSLGEILWHEILWPHLPFSYLLLHTMFPTPHSRLFPESKQWGFGQHRMPIRMLLGLQAISNF